MAVFGFSGHGFSVDHQLMLVPSDVQYALGADTRPMPLHWLESKLREAGFTDVVLILVRRRSRHRSAATRKRRRC